VLVLLELVFPGRVVESVQGRDPSLVPHSTGRILVAVKLAQSVSSLEPNF
jgi:hypothetical protein